MTARTAWRIAVTSALAAAVTLSGPVAPVSADHVDDRDCSDFDYQEDAQEWMDAHPGDPDRLDSDDDGRACEALPSRTVTPMPPPVTECEPSARVQGAIRDRYVSLDGPCGFLGEPLTSELPTPARPGAYNDFEGGSIYWSAPTGAWEVHGDIRGTWSRLGRENGALGFPVTNENRTPDDPGAYNHFEGGSVYWSPAIGAREVRGSIRVTWARLGWENSTLGFPTTNELPTPTKPGAYNHFQAGSIYWSPATGAHEVRGAIREAWARRGWENSALGFPTSDEYAVPGGRASDFQFGRIVWTPQRGAVVS